MKEIYRLSPSSIFEVANEEVFLEREDDAHKDYINCRDHYELFYAISKYYNPDSILEIGTRYGYSLYSLILGSSVLNKVVGYDINEEYVKVTDENLSTNTVSRVNLKLEVADTQKIDELDDKYRLIHIDGDKSFAGTYHDLKLTRGKARVVLVSDFYSERTVRDATQRFVYDNKEKIKKTHVIESLRGLYIIEYRG
mgnify:FL=1